VVLPPLVGFLGGLVVCLLLPGSRAALPPLLLLPLVALGWVGTGAALCRVLRLEVGTAVRVGLGAGACNTVLFLGGLGGLYQWPILAWFPVVLAPLGLRDLLRDLRTAAPAHPVVAAMHAFQGLIAALLLLVVAVPAMDPDTMTYHFALPELWTVEGHFVHVPTLHYSYFPLAAEQGFVMARLWLAALPERGWTLAQGFGILHGLLLARAVVGLAGRDDTRSRLAGETAGLLVLMVPATLLTSGLPYNDAYGAALAILALGQALRWLREPTDSRAIAVGLLLGFAMAAKYTLLVAPPILLVVAWLGAPTGFAAPRAIRGISIAAAAAAVVCVPWYVKTLLATGNPVYPVAYGLLGGAPEGSLAWDVHAIRVNQGAAALGAGWHPLRWLTAPIELWMRPLGFGTLPRVGPNLLVAVPFLLWALRPGGVRRERALTVGALLFYLFWSVTSRNARFLLPVLALALIVTAHAMIRIARRGRPWGLAVFAAVAALLAWNATQATSVFSTLLKPARFLSGAESRQEYLSARRRPHEVLRWASAQLPRDANVLFVGETRSLGLERNRLVGGALDPSPLLWLQERTGGTTFIDAVKRSGLTHVLVDPSAAEHLSDERDRYRGRIADARALVRWLSTEGKLLFRSNDVLLYEVPGARGSLESNSSGRQQNGLPSP
jgi:hypothetical protein